MTDDVIVALENVGSFGITVEDDFHEILINLDIVNCLGLLYSEGPKDRGLSDNEGNGHFQKSVENGWGAVVPPVASNPTTSQGGVAILCPHRQALGRCLGEHPIPLGRGAVGVGDAVAVGCLGTLLEGTAPHRVGLCQVEQEGGTVGADHLGAVQQQGGDPLGVTHEGGEAAGGDELDHGLRCEAGGEGSPPSLESILQHRVPLSRVERPNRDSPPTGTASAWRGAVAVLDLR